MKARFKSEEARQQFIDYGEKRWAIGPLGDTNNNRHIACHLGMKEFDVVKLNSPFAGWFDIVIDGTVFESIASDEVCFFEFID
ncbi:nuclease [Aeromonas phage AS-gz]|uniref:Uncharacterized protein n=1 Tax=Aeromonas phage AS-gz TaxID=2026082 RepID=A0A223LDS7_9CAUD|nr:nuclease [Aeromonas phage AS-gz]ASU00640.1 hypothetical protein [Aeromonas phage AS-gz]